MNYSRLRFALLCGVIAVLAGLAFAVAGCGIGRNKADLRLEAASNYIQRGKLKQAKSEIDAAIRLDPSRSLTYTTIGTICVNELPDEGAAALQTLLARNKAHKLDRALSENDIINAYGHLGSCLMSGKKYLAAERAYKAVLARSPNNVGALNDLGYSYAIQNIKLQEAMKLLNRADKLSPNNPVILDSLGWTQYRLGRYDDALCNLRLAVRLDPNEPTLRYHAGAAYAKRKHYIAARIELEKSLVLDKTMTDARKLLKSLPKPRF